MVLPPNFVLRQQGGFALWVDRDVADKDFLDVLTDADGLFKNPTCRIVKDQRKIKVAWLKLSIAGRERFLYVKRYNSFSLRFKFLSPFFQSGALRALKGAAILQRARIAAARPVAGVEKRKYGILLNSFFISDEIAGGKTADTYWVENLQGRAGPDGFRCRRQFIQRLAELFRLLHTERIYHDDLKDANILAVSQGSDADCVLYLLDLEGVRRSNHLTKRRRVKNLVQLYRTLGKYLSRPQQLSFLEGYLGASFLDRGRKRAWIIGVLRHARQVDRTKAQKGAETVFSIGSNDG